MEGSLLDERSVSVCRDNFSSALWTAAEALKIWLLDTSLEDVEDMVADVLRVGKQLWQSYPRFDVMSGLLEYRNGKDFVACECWKVL